MDDNATNRRILDEMLASWHMKPTVVADAAAALDVLRRASPTRRRFDAVIVDGQMPDVDGFMLARRDQVRSSSSGDASGDAHLGRPA